MPVRSHVSLVMVRAVGEPVARAVLPVYAGLGLIGAVLFGPTGLTPDTVVAAEHEWVGVRLALWAVWLSGSAAAVREALLAEKATYFRALPIGAGLHLGVSLGLAVAVQLPWIALFGMGGGWLAAARAGALAVAAGAVLAVGPRGGLERVVRGMGLAGIAAVLWHPIGAAIEAPAAMVMFAVAGRAAWVRAPERNRWVVRVVRGGPVTALAASGVAYLVRRRRAHGERALMLAGFGVLAAVLLSSSNQVEAAATASALALGVGAVVLSIGAGALAVPLVEHERSARWLLDSTGVPLITRAVASLAPLMAAMALLGAAIGAGVMAAVGGAALRALVTSMIAGAAWGALSLAVVRRCERRDGVDATRALSQLFLLAVMMEAAVIALGDAAVLGLAAAGAGGTLLGAPRLEAPAQHWSREP